MSHTQMENNGCETKKLSVFARFLPPGMNPEGELIFFLLMNIAALGYAFLFLTRYFDAYSNLYVYRYGSDTQVIAEGAQMEPFYVLFDHAWAGFLLTALCMLLYGITHYTYYYQGTKSIYLMKRLPDKTALYRRTWLLTLCEVGVCLFLAVLWLGISFCVYRYVTPAECLPAGQWTQFWNHFWEVQ